MRIPLRSALALLGFALPASAQTVLFSEGFENGLANWNATGMWHVESDSDACVSHVLPLPEGSHCAYYGNPGACNYENGTANSGNLTLLAPIAIPNGVPSARLHCWSRHSTEACIYAANFDNFLVQVSSNGGTNWTTIGTRCSFDGLGAPNDVWGPRGMSLDAYRGHSILLRFRFDTGDDIDNLHPGAFVDAIEVRTEAGHVFCAGACPCNGTFNDIPMGYGNTSGCDNSVRHEGELAAGGTPSVANDTVVLAATGLVAPVRALFLQTQTFGNGVFNGDGRFCLTGSSVRLGVRISQTDAVLLPGPGDPPLSVLGGVPAAGGTRHYQVVYRDPADYFCSSSTVNHTNGYTITWTP